MKCPHCGETLPFLHCPECGGETSEGSEFCSQCGKRVRKETSEIDFSERIPCADGNCVGTINEKGVCNACGKPHSGEQV